MDEWGKWATVLFWCADEMCVHGDSICCQRGVNNDGVGSPKGVISDSVTVSSQGNVSNKCQ